MSDFGIDLRHDGLERCACGVLTDEAPRPGCAKPAPYYDEGGITIYHGDCRDVLPQLCLEHPARGYCFVTDPPYGVALKARSSKHGARAGHYTQFEDTPEYVERVAVPIVRYLADACVGGAVTPGTTNMWLYPRPADVGALWAPAGAGMSSWGFCCSHPILYYGKDPFLARGMGSRPNGFQWNSATEENGHPCPKPLKVMQWLVQRVSVPGQTVLDPFMGSGTTLHAAKNCGARAIGIEIEERYCEVAAKRLAQEVFDFG